ncbi:MAG: glycosyltransferase family 4 protein [Candidatus Hodarchaeales archaeon]|jgi:1,2-diacylglycerol-3-alpha-glucose alpha-1,2-glucosyltransferase
MHNLDTNFWFKLVIQVLAYMEVFIHHMKVNFILDMEKGLVGSGVYNSAVRLAKQLESFGITTDINGKHPPYDIYHFQTALPQSLIKARILNRRISRKYKIVMTGHTTIEDFRNSFLFSNRIDYALIPYLTKYYSYADYLVAVSDYNKMILQKYGFNPAAIRVISNGIDLSTNRKNSLIRQKARKHLHLRDNEFLVITVGLCIYRKAPDVFAETAIITPNHRFMWIGKYLPLGTIAHSPYLRKHFQKAQVTSNLQFTGYLSKQTLEALWNAADIFLYVSREENQGIALLESIAYGNIPVIRDHPVFNWLDDGKNCLKGRTPDEFSAHISKLASNKTLQNKLVRHGNDTLRKHDIQKSIRALADLYSELV